MVQGMVVGGLGGPKAVDPARSDLLLCWAMCVGDRLGQGCSG